MNHFDIGMYVQTKSAPLKIGLVVESNETKTKVLFGNQTKLEFNTTNLTALEVKAVLINYRGINYLVTPMKAIISLKSKRIMAWDDSNGDRKGILKLYNEKVGTK